MQQVKDNTFMPPEDFDIESLAEMLKDSKTQHVEVFTGDKLEERKQLTGSLYIPQKGIKRVSHTNLKKK